MITAADGVAGHRPRSGPPGRVDPRHRYDLSDKVLRSDRRDITMRMLLAVAPVVVVLLLFERPVHAYLDPGSGSMLLQVLLGGFAAVGVVARLYWHRLTAVGVVARLYWHRLTAAVRRKEGPQEPR